MSLPVGAFGLFDFTFLPVGAPSNRHGHFLGAGRYSHRVLLRLMAEEAARLKANAARLHPQVLLDVLAANAQRDFDAFIKRRENKAAAWALLLSEI